MTTTRHDDHRLRAGTFTSAGITSTYAILNWTAQADQLQDNQTVIPWAGPFQCLPPEYARVAGAADLTQRPDGFLHGVLGPFSYWTFGMMNYLITTVFPASVYYAAVSMMLYDITDTAIYVNATMARPVIGQDFEPEIGGWKNIKLRYEMGSLTS